MCLEEFKIVSEQLSCDQIWPGLAYLYCSCKPNWYIFFRFFGTIFFYVRVFSWNVFTSLTASLVIFTMELNLTTSVLEVLFFQWNHGYEIVENVAAWSEGSLLYHEHKSLSDTMYSVKVLKALKSSKTTW